MRSCTYVEFHGLDKTNNVINAILIKEWSFVADKNFVWQAFDIVSNVQALHADLSGLKIKPLTFLNTKTFSK